MISFPTQKKVDFFYFLRHQIFNSTSGKQTFLEIHVQSLRSLMNEDKLD